MLTKFLSKKPKNLRNFDQENQNFNNILQKTKKLSEIWQNFTKKQKNYQKFDKIWRETKILTSFDLGTKNDYQFLPENPNIWQI